MPQTIGIAHCKDVAVYILVPLMMLLYKNPNGGDALNAFLPPAAINHTRGAITTEHVYSSDASRMFSLLPRRVFLYGLRSACCFYDVWSLIMHDYCRILHIITLCFSPLHKKLCSMFRTALKYLF